MKAGGASSIVLLVMAAGAARGAADIPEWARQAAAQTVPSYPAKVTSVVLLREEMVNVDADGKRVMRERGAVKVLQRGADPVRAVRYYDTKNGRIRDFQGWLLPPAGKPVAYAKNRILDVAVSQDYVFDETRAKVMDFGTVAPSSILAWEITEEEKTVFTQDAFQFQNESPVLVSRFVVTLPPGWEASGVVFNRDGVKPQVSSSTYTWEVRELPWMEREEYSPPLALRVPRLTVSYFPPTDNRAGLSGLKDWPSVSAWVSQLMDPQAEVTDSIRTKAQQLTAGAADETAKIRAIAAFVQQTNYVEVSLNLTRGGGYTPHRADETLAKNYGDCKDKSTLMRALLKAVGIDAYVTVISASDRNYVRPEWASPTQFNHAIVAVRVSDGVSLPTVIRDDKLGRLLMFDPTDRITPVGDLPEVEQGSHALVLAGLQGALLKMPLLPASANRIDSSIEATLDMDGRLKARVQRQYFGQSGVPLRRVEKLRGGDELKRRFERGWSGRLGGVMLDQIATESDSIQDHISVSLALSAEHFGQIAQNLLIVRPGVLTSGGDYNFAPKARSSPVHLEADVRHDSVRVKLPAGYKLDELPAPAKIDSSYGSFTASWVVRDGELVLDQSLEIHDTTAPASEYARIRDFFERAAGAQFAPVVLVRQ